MKRALFALAALTALRYPENEFVSVPAARAYCEPARPFLPSEQQAPALSAQQAHDAAHVSLRQAGGDDLARTAVFFHVGADDGVKYLIGRQGILVSLIRLQFSRGRADDDVFRDHR